MEDQYNLSDLRHLITNSTTTSSRPHHHHHDLLFPASHRHLTNPDNNPNPNHYYDMMMMSVVGGGVSTTARAAHHHPLTHEMMPRGFSEIHVAAMDNNTTTKTTTTASALEDHIVCSVGGGDGGTGRWPRQETLTLLEIRSCLDLKFKESIQKGPLWDEVSRIMYEEHGYQRSGKKCREKFENLYKYYKKTKEGKAGRQDGKHYRFFRQLEALYGSSDQTSIKEKQLIILSPNNNFQFNPTVQNTNNSSLSLSNNSSYYDTSSSNEDESIDKSNNNNSNNSKRRKRSWKMKVRDFIDLQMKKLMEKQELWLDKMMKTIEHREQERIFREEEWRKQEMIRVEKEHKFWASERSWIEARDAALMGALHKLSSNKDVGDEALIGVANENYLMMKKRKENYYNSRSTSNYEICGYNNNNNQHNQGLVINDGSSSSPPNSNVVGNNHNNVQDQGCYRFFIGDVGGDNQHVLWDNYGVKLNNNGGSSN